MDADNINWIKVLKGPGMFFRVLLRGWQFTRDPRLQIPAMNVLSLVFDNLKISLVKYLCMWTTHATAQHCDLKGFFLTISKSQISDKV